MDIAPVEVKAIWLALQSVEAHFRTGADQPGVVLILPDWYDDLRRLYERAAEAVSDGEYTTLREQVAQIVADLATGDGEAPGPPMVEDYAVADAVLPVVLAAVTEQIEALGTDWTIIRAGEARYEPGKASGFKREALNAVARLGAVPDGE